MIALTIETFFFFLIKMSWSFTVSQDTKKTPTGWKVTDFSAGRLLWRLSRCGFCLSESVIKDEGTEVWNAWPILFFCLLISCQRRSRRGGITLRDSERTKQDEQSGKVCLSESKRKNMNLWPAFVLLTGRKMQSDSHVGSLGWFPASKHSYNN